MKTVASLLETMMYSTETGKSVLHVGFTLRDFVDCRKREGPSVCKEESKEQNVTSFSSHETNFDWSLR